MTTADLGYRAFDTDNHYYEALDAFTRHLDPALGPRTLQWAEIDGRKYHVVGGRVSHAVVNPTFDPVADPGVLVEYYRGNPEGKPAAEYLKARGPISPAYRDAGARLAAMDGQGLDGCWMFPTLAVLYEELLGNDIEAIGQLFRAFNRWLDEDWGFHNAERIFAAPYISPSDPNWAVAELAWALDRGAHIICIRPAAPMTPFGRRPPADPYFDRFWSAVNDAGITVVVHAGDSGHSFNGYAPSEYSAVHGKANLFRMLVRERPIYDFLGSVIIDRLFERFPNVRLASVENGATFLPGLFTELHALAMRNRGLFRDDPIETFKAHVAINPFWEDDLGMLVEHVGSDGVIFGSDWPHVEGMRQPLDYLVETKALDAANRRKVMRDNALALNTLRPL
ncbi:MAG: amidohydrolase [Actinobacteria bacterium]|nr:MAG: amidohydrolase [Actinomycetota bacterium]